MVEPGKLRPSQIITTFGPGSIVNMEHDAIMLMGLHKWKDNRDDKRYFQNINHPYLQNLLNVSFFKMPITVKGDSAVPCISFPQYGVCPNPKCNRIQKHSKESENKGGGFYCRYCEWGKKKQYHLYHARFVQICDNGHIDDFPWNRWTHKHDKKNRGGCKASKEDEKLTFRSLGRSSGLSDYRVECLHCGAFASCAGATDKRVLERDLGFTCYANQPWLGQSPKHHDKKCSETPYGVQTRASSIYYSSVSSALLIPSWIHPVHDVLDGKDGQSSTMVRGLRENGQSFEEIINLLKPSVFGKLLEKHSLDEIKKQLELRYEEIPDETANLKNVLDIEFENLKDIKTRLIKPSIDDPRIDVEPISLEGQLVEYLDFLKKINRITEIKVLRGFTRGKPPDPFAPETFSKKNERFRPISPGSRNVDGTTVPIQWLPGVQNNGEGIFFSLNEKKLREWEERKQVKERFEGLRENYITAVEKQKRSKSEYIIDAFSRPRYVLLHTLSHLLIRQLSITSGYHEGDIKERIYQSKNTNGIMMYTASVSSQGSLGGLVRIGEGKRFLHLLKESIKRSTRCSRDPMCVENNPDKIKQAGIITSNMGGSSCYSCTLLPETSCENFNNLLDRWTISNPEYGFFKELISEQS